MPVAVSAPATQASTSKIIQKSWHEDRSLPDASSSTRKPRKRKGNVTKQPQIEVVAPTAETSNAVEDEPWLWHSLTDSSASRVVPLFTKDGKCVHSQSLEESSQANA